MKPKRKRKQPSHNPALEAFDRERRRAFVEHYLAIGKETFGNGTKSALAAGYAKSGCRTQAHRLLKDPDVIAAIAERQQVRSDRAELSAVRVLEELRRLAFLDPLDLFNEFGNLKPLKDIPAEARSAIAGLEVARVNLVPNDNAQEWLHKIKLASKVDALTLLAKHFKLTTETIEVKGDWDKLVARLAAARKRAK